jgi:cell division septation protein DedD
VSSSTNDEGFREIQLNGKQLVFLFMAATVVSVVIFLCGVLVGRGVRPERAPVQDAASAKISADPSAAASAAAQNPAPPVGLPTGPPAFLDETTYSVRLLNDTPPKETLKPVAAPAPEVTRPPKPQPPAQPPPKSAPPPMVAALDPSGPGFAVQVSIFDNRREAEVLAKQLIAKGYPAFVMDPVKGAPRAIYRVRVGKYKNRKDAETISTRLEKAEQFTPWIAR